MKDSFFIARQVAKVKRSAVFVWLLPLVLTGLGGAKAQAPAWDLAMSGGNQIGTGTSQALASTTDASGNVFVTGRFTGSVAFGSTILTNAGTGGTTDVFVAKWDASAQSFTWATSGGGPGIDVGNAIAVRGTGVFITGCFDSNARIAGQVLTGNGAGGLDAFVAKYMDTSTGNTPVTSSFANGWATSGGGETDDVGRGIAVSGSGVFVTGFCGGANVRFAGQTLVGGLFVVKYIDTSTGNTPATSSFANGWATSSASAVGYGITTSGAGVFVTGEFIGTSTVRIAGQLLTGAGYSDMFVAKYVDTSTGSTPATSSFSNAWATSGGGMRDDHGNSIAVSGTNVFVTGFFTSGYNANFAGLPLVGAGARDMFVAKYIDTSTGSTPATSSFANGWATSGGGPDVEVGHSIVVRGSGVFVTGQFTSGPSTIIAGQMMAGAGGYNMFVAKYNDTSTGNTPATSSFANAWATSGSGGGTGVNVGQGIAISGQRVYAVGYVSPPATFGNIRFGTTASIQINFLARLTDPTLLAAHSEAPAASALTLAPNPTHAAPVTLRGAAQCTTIQVLNALGRPVATATADAAGTAILPAGLTPGVYVVRNGSSAARLVVE